MQSILSWRVLIAYDDRTAELEVIPFPKIKLCWQAISPLFRYAFSLFFFPRANGLYQ
jgi:hypothetical protein